MKKTLLFTLTALTVASACLSRAAAQTQNTGGSSWVGKKSGWQLLKPGEQAQVMKFGEEYKRFMTAARTPATTVTEGIRVASEAGFRELRSGERAKPGDRIFLNNRGRALMLAVMGTEPVENGLRMIVSHIDSPRIEMKARPFFTAQGVTLVKTINHGGIKNYQWANRPLQINGRIDRKDGSTLWINLGDKGGDPVFMIPDLEPHDDNDLRSRSYQNVLNQEELNPVVGSIPSATGDSLAGTLDAVMAEYKITEEDIVSAELIFTPAFTPSDLGFDRGLVAAYGQDDRLSSYAGMRALISLERTPSRTAVVYWTNNEEVDSVNNTGAGSNWVEWAMQEIATAQTPERAGERSRTAILKTEVISADTNAGMNPIFPSAQDPLNAARLGYGVTIKRYGRGFDAASEFTARFRKLFDDRGIPWQTATYRADLPGGGTVGLFFSARGMEVIDLGVPLLSMHAPVEASSKVDLWNFHRAMLAFLGQ